MGLTPLGVAALGLLGERDMHPYEMFQTLIARSEDQLVKVRPGTLYHAVDRLAQSGLVQPVGTARSGNRPERTTYRITSVGEEALRAWVRATVASPQQEFPVFPVAISELASLPAAEAVELLELRLTALREDAALYRDAAVTTAADGVAERFMLDVDYLAAILAAEVAWIERLVERLRTNDIDWPEPAGIAAREPIGSATLRRGPHPS